MHIYMWVALLALRGAVCAGKHVRVYVYELPTELSLQSVHSAFGLHGQNPNTPLSNPAGNLENFYVYGLGPPYTQSNRFNLTGGRSVYERWNVT